MTHLAAASATIARLERQARPTKREPKTRGARSWLIICPRCVELGRDVTEHYMRSPHAQGCEEHKHYLRTRRYRENNPVRAKNSRRSYHIEHRDKLAVYMNTHYWEHREERLEKQREYDAAHREEKIAANRAYQRSWRDRWKLCPWRERGVQPAPPCVPAECF